MVPKVERLEGGLVVSAIFDAPPERVFAAWTDPKQVQAWWGCAQSTHVRSTVDLRVGGSYRHVMQVTGCGECIVEGHFTEIIPPTRLGFIVKGQHIEGYPLVPDTVNIVEFLPAGRQTRVQLRVSGLQGSPHEGTIAEGWSAGFSKLGELVRA